MDTHDITIEETRKKLAEHDDAEIRRLDSKIAVLEDKLKDNDNFDYFDYECEGCKCQARINHSLLQKINFIIKIVESTTRERDELKVCCDHWKTSYDERNGKIVESLECINEWWGDWKAIVHEVKQILSMQADSDKGGKE
jgi:hypothetical protein